MPSPQRRDHLRRALAAWPFLIADPSEETVRLCDTALRHDSYVNERRPADPDADREDNERLEFLGDAVLELMVRERLYLRSDLDEGGMTWELQRLISNNALAAGLRRAPLDLEGVLLTGEGQKELSDRMLAGAFEAMLGALYLSEGLGPVSEVCRRLFLDPDI